ncbi:MAG: anaerobic ribonucleoside-triphosphate reductase activating protein [Thermodesulfobacteriota bacterium]|nr:anaerobic ribonucleoside-triphosphate reductase activating protein [Thermodesulfobacteriota bacterium]
MSSLPDFEIKGFLETSFLDWPGQVASVIFLARCNFRCPFCHNHGLVLEPEDFPTLEWPVIRARLKKFAGWVDGVVISGGEPTLSPGLSGLIREIKGLGFKIKLDTNGSRPGVVASLMEQGLLDHVAMDVKAPLDEASYARAAGRPGFLAQAKQTLKLLQNSDLPFTLRTTIVPGIHSEEDILGLAGQLAYAPEWTLQNFNPENTLDPSLQSREPWDPDVFEELCRKALRVMGLVA